MSKIEQYYKQVKCPECEWSQFNSGEAVGMTPCLRCNSTGYLYERIEPNLEKLSSPIAEAYFRGRRDGMTIREFQSEPDDSRLLTDEGIMNVMLECGGRNNPEVADYDKELIRKQDAKTASIKDGEITELKEQVDYMHEAHEVLVEFLEDECQETIKGIVEAYDNMLDGMGLGRNNFKKSDWDYVQSLKDKCLK